MNIKKKEAKKMIKLLDDKARYALQNMMFAIEHKLPIESQFRGEAKAYLDLRDELMRGLKKQLFGSRFDRVYSFSFSRKLHTVL